ncbi:anthranilate synthase component I [Planctomycetota bacterium]|nr:anthranilate synthase component I [Planctomycetota bacterium]
MSPDLASCRALAGQGYTLIPVIRRLVADELTPVGVLARLRDEPHAFLFESVVGGERLARYSMLGIAPVARLTARLDRDGGRVAVETAAGRELLPGDLYSGVRAYAQRLRSPQVPGLPRFSGGLVGWFAYDAVRCVEPLPHPPADPLGLPVLCLARYDTVLVFDHSYNQLLLIAHLDLTSGQSVESAYAQAQRELDALQRRLETPLPPRLVEPGLGEPLNYQQHTSRAEFEAGVRRCQDFIAAGDAFQIVLSQRLSAPCTLTPFQIYRSLRSLNPSPYLFYLRSGDTALVGASPEILVRVEDGTVSLRPIAGTALRGKDAAEDERLAAALLADPKERAEHTMLIDLGRNDVGRVCKPGSVHLTETMVIERYSHVQHIVSHVEGTLRDDCDALATLRSCHPAGTVSGAPKVRAMQIIDELEPVRRGPYAGAVGYLDFRGNLDTCIALRTAILTPGEVHVHVGAGIVADSDPAMEYEECLRKARATLEAIARAARF